MPKLQANCTQCQKSFTYRTEQQLGIFCSYACQQEDRYERVTKPKIEAGLCDTRSTLKRYITKERGYACSECGIDEWMGQPITLELDHIDGDAGNNLPSNLRLLCPNCHACTPTWKNRNKGNGRASRGLRLN